MTKPTKFQLRGNCPCCGRDQAVLASGKMSKHGYTVDHGWFNGVCVGQQYRPMQQDRKITDTIIAQVRTEVAELLKTAADLEAGKAFPATIERRGNRLPGSFKREVIAVPFAEGSDHEKQEAVSSAIYRATSRARAGTSFANDMEALVNRVHGQPLREVPVDNGPAPIRSGEKRVTADGLVLTEGRNVYEGKGRVTYTYTGKNRDGQDVKKQGWMGLAAWRKLPLAD